MILPGVYFAIKASILHHKEYVNNAHKIVFNALLNIVLSQDLFLGNLEPQSFKDKLFLAK